MDNTASFAVDSWGLIEYKDDKGKKFRRKKGNFSMTSSIYCVLIRFKNRNRKFEPPEQRSTYCYN